MKLNEIKRVLSNGDYVVFYYEAFLVTENGGRAERITITGSPPIGSSPPPGQLTVTNLYVDAVTKKLVVEYDDTPVKE